IDLPDADERLRFLQSGWAETMADGEAFSDWSDFTPQDVAARTAGLNLLRIRHFLAEAIRNGTRVTMDLVTASKKQLIEEYCQGLVRFKDPKPGVSLDYVATEADAVFGTREADGDSGVSGRVFAAFAAHIGDSTLRGRELWVAMTSRPDLLSIDMKRQGRFGLCIPLFPAQGPDDVIELFRTVA